MLYCQIGFRQFKYYGGEVIGKVFGGMGEQFDMVGISQLGEENFLCVYNCFVGDCFGIVEGCVLEYWIDYVVKVDGVGQLYEEVIEECINDILVCDCSVG